MIGKIDIHEFVSSIMEMLEMRDYYTSGHSERVADYSELLAVHLFSDDEVIYQTHIAAHLHDIGKVGVRDYILSKRGKLSFEEYEEMKKHTLYGYEILRKVKGMEKLASIVRSHHERWDGGGYPDGLMGENIPVEARIIAICDTFDAMTINRVYRQKMEIEDALNLISMEKWKQFDGNIVEIFVEIVKKNSDKIVKIINNHQ